ncbi:MAG: signal peptidase II [Anaerolineae bacterium]|nr:signal peptidase II [Anaerolineae bacterium]
MWDINRYTVLAFGVLVADQMFDLMVELAMPIGASVMLFGAWFGVTRFDGPSGGALDTNGFFTLLAIILIPFFVKFKMRPTPDPLYGFGISLLIGGLPGNLADGLRVGHPVDYFVLGRAFNVADAALLTGASLLIYRLRRREHGRVKND